MIDELLALAGDLVFERKRLSESLRRLEGTILHSELTKELYRKMGVQNVEGVHAEFDLLARSLDRLGALTKTLVHQVNHDRLTSAEPLLAEGVMTVEQSAQRLERPVTVDCKSNDVQIDRDLLEKFKPIFFEMLATLVEFSIEPAKERAARKKRARAYFQFEAKSTEEGYRLMVICDGNGILPPMVADHGIKLASIGVRASFEGKPGAWSAWIFHLPSDLGAFRCISVRIGKRRLCIPAFAVSKVMTLPANDSPEFSKVSKFYSLDEELNRIELDRGYESRHGKFLIVVSSGTDTSNYVVEEVVEADEAFMKPLHPLFSGNGRFLGVVVTEESRPDNAPAYEDHNELCLVFNPAYLVYGADALLDSEAEKNEGKHAV